IDVRLAAWNSGKLDNAIPRDGKAVFAVPADKKEEVMADWNVFTKGIEEEYHVSDPNAVWGMESTEARPVIEKDVARRLIMAVQAV
ncbi:hypothetical protein, partial [Enterobacter asburiae]